MSASPPPLKANALAAADKAVARAAGVARVSSGVMIVLGALSMLVSVTAPLSASFAISVAVFANGWIERHFGRRLAARCVAAPRRLALNQVALGFEIAAYATWQARAIGPDQLDAVLHRPLVARLLAALDPAVLEELLTKLPTAVRAVYVVVGAATFLGCVATAWYYLSRSRALRLLAAVPAEATPPQSSPPSS